MSLDVPPRRPASVFGGQRTSPVPRKVERNTRVAIDSKKASRHGLRHRQLLRVSDSVTVAASAAVGAVLIHHISAARAGGDLGVRDVIVVAVAMAVALHLHGLYRRPDARLRPSEWWRPTVIARCLPTAAFLHLLPMRSSSAASER